MRYSKEWEVKKSRLIFKAYCNNVSSSLSRDWAGGSTSKMTTKPFTRGSWRPFGKYQIERAWTGCTNFNVIRWVFKQLFDKGLVYRGFKVTPEKNKFRIKLSIIGVKVMPYSTACSTPLSNFESNQNYKDVTDPAVIVSFPLDESPDVSIIAWTTTPWTLPSNLAVCVHPTLTYVKVKGKEEREKKRKIFLHNKRSFLSVDFFSR